MRPFHNVFKMLYHVFLCLQLDRSQSPFYQSGSANAARPILMQMWIWRVARDWNHLIFCRTEASGDWVLEAGAWYLSWAIIFKDFDLCLFSSCHNLDVLRCLLLVDVSLQKHFVSDISMGSRFSPGFLSIHVYDVYNTDDKYKSVFIRNHWTTVRTENQLMQRMSMKYFNILVKNSFPRNSFNYINASNITSMNSTFIRIFFDSSHIRHKQIWDDYLFWS